MAHDTLAPWAESVPGSEDFMTEDELLRLPDGEWKYELVEGRLIRMTPTGLEHRDVVMNLLTAMSSFVKSRNLGLVTPPDTGYRLPTSGKRQTILSPDIGFVTAERVKLLPPKGSRERKKYLPLAPDLAVEVASPDQFHPEMEKKARLYLRSGVQLVWVIWPDDQQADVWRPGAETPVATLGASETLDGLDVLPEFRYSVADLFL